MFKYIATVLKSYARVSSYKLRARLEHAADVTAHCRSLACSLRRPRRVCCSRLNCGNRGIGLITPQSKASSKGASIATQVSGPQPETSDQNQDAEFRGMNGSPSEATPCVASRAICGCIAVAKEKRKPQNPCHSAPTGSCLSNVVSSDAARCSGRGRSALRAG